jgi:hypothetical protein
MRKPKQPKMSNGLIVATPARAAHFNRSIASSLQSAKPQTAVEAALHQKFLAALASELACLPAEYAAISG